MKHINKEYLSFFSTFSRTFLVSVFICLISLYFYSLKDNFIFADENSEETTTFIAFDANYFDENDLEIAKDVLFQIVNFSSINENKTIILQAYSEKNFSPITLEKENIDTTLNDFITNLDPKNQNMNSNHYLIISEAFTKIAEREDTKGSELFLISNLNLNSQEESSEIKLKNLSDLYSSSNIKLNVMALPSSGSKNRELFKDFASNTGGDFIDFGIKSSISDFIKIFMINPVSMLETNITPKPLSNFVNIPPTVDKLIIGIYRQDSNTSVSIINPDGIEINPEIDSNYWHLGKLLYLDVSKPQSGTWTIITHGNTGKFEIITDTNNPLKLESLNEKVFSVESEIVLKVGAYVEGNLQNISNAEMQVRIRDNTGAETIQIMNDLGQNKDEIAFDGIYTANLPGIKDQSIIDVEYTLQWKNLSTPVKHNDQIKVEHFPEIMIKEISDVQGKNNKDFLIVVFETKVNNYPHLVGIDEIEHKLISEVGKYSYSIKPVKLKDTHKSYIFKIFLNSEEKIEEKIFIDLSLDTIFLDKSHKTIIKKVSVDVDTNSLYWLGLRYYYWLPIIPVVIIIIFLILIFIRQTKITGFLVDVENNVIVDFSEVSRNIIKKFLHPKRISFSDVKELPYTSGYFEFDGENVFMEIIPNPEDPSIRINSYPATGRNEITQRQWIGSSGKQVRFNKDIPYIKI